MRRSVGRRADDPSPVEAWCESVPGDPPDVLHAIRIGALRALVEHLGR